MLFFGSNFRPNWPKMSCNLFGIYVTLETYSFLFFYLPPWGLFCFFYTGVSNQNAVTVHSKFHHNWVSNSRDIANIEFLWGGGVVGWGGMQSHFRV